MREAPDELTNTLVDKDTELSNARISQGELRNRIRGHGELAETENSDTELGNVDYSSTELTYCDDPNRDHWDPVWSMLE